MSEMLIPAISGACSLMSGSTALRTARILKNHLTRRASLRLSELCDAKRCGSVSQPRDGRWRARAGGWDDGGVPFIHLINYAVQMFCVVHF